jgi:hypothetical protein
MLKDVDDKPVEPARKKAERRWGNYDLEKRFKEEKAKPPPAPEKPNEPEDGRGSVIRAQTKFGKDIRAMMEGHAKRNEILYAVSIRAQRYRLLKEKLRRLEARQKLRDSWEQPNV